MTVPKFRAWDAESKTMYEVKTLNFILKAGVCVNHEALFKERTLYFDDNAILMQSTGQKDCNNSKIFDADILLEPWTGHVVGRVFYSLGDSAWKVLLVSGEEYLSDCLDLQVCGNIYENPDLLEE